MSLRYSRREVIAQLAAIAALPAVRFRRFELFASDPLDGTIADYQAGRRAGAWTAEQVTRRALDRCHDVGARLHAIDVLDPDVAIGFARDSDFRLRNDTLKSPLDGVPVFAKAIYDMNGLPTTGSNAEWARLFPEPLRRDSIEVDRLRRAGAVILGKTAADDFAYHGNGTSSHTGQVLNPHDPTGTRTPGGSSAGSAVAVSTGLAFAALGTDDGGSNRIPAQFTGIVGMKPTFGMIPRTGVIPTWPYLDTHGPLARTPADALQLFAWLVGADASDPLALEHPSLYSQPETLAGRTLGIPDDNVPRAQMSVEALALWDRAVGTVERAGAKIVHFTPPVNRMNFRARFVERASARGDVAVNPDSPPPTANALYRYFAGRTDDPKAAIRKGYDAYRKFYDVLPATYEECEPLFAKPMTDDPAGVSFARSRGEVVAMLKASMKEAGVEGMIYPTMPFNAPRALDKWPDIRTTLGFGNWLGLPEVSVPVGLGADGMPGMNISFVGLPGDDARTLAWAHGYYSARA